MFKKTAIIAGLGLAISGAAQAQEKPQEAIVTGDKFIDTYRWELNADYTAGEYSFNGFDDTEQDEFSISGSFYFQPVDTTLGPRGEAAFLDHASDVTLAYTYREVDDNGIDVDGDTYGISGRWVTNGGFIFEGQYIRDEPLDAEIDIFRLSAGYYITEVTSLIIDYVDGDVDEGGDTDGWNARIEHFWDIGNGGIKLNGNYGFVNVDDADDIDLYGLGAIWYVTHDLGFGVSYDNTQFANVEAETYSIYAEWFINRNIAVNLAYSHEEPDDFDFDNDDINNDLNDLDAEYDAITLGATLRF